MAGDVLARFHPAVARWFRRRLGEPSPPQALGWPAIAKGRHTLILSPTGSGKTLAAFLWCLDELWRAGGEHVGVHTLYISPLKALGHDIQRNLQVPLVEIPEEAAGSGERLPVLRTAIRTGDTPSSARARMARDPPHVLITTPESLYLMLTSAASREALRDVRYVIVDEIHALAGTKRGAHLALSLERLEEVQRGRGPVRIGLSATQRPLDEVARFLGGHAWGEDGELEERAVAVIDAGRPKKLDLEVLVPVKDLADVAEGTVWPGAFERLLELVRRHTTTLVFANNRRLAERVARELNALAGEEIARAHHGSMSKESRLLVEADLKEGRLPCLVATSSLELGIDVGAIDLVVLLQSPKGVARGLQRVGRAGHSVGETSVGRFMATHRADLLESAAVSRAMRAGRVEETRAPRDPLDVLAQQIVAAVAEEPRDVEALYRLARRAHPFRDLHRDTFLGVVEMVSGRHPARLHAELKARVSYDRVNGRLNALPGTRLLALSNGGTITDRGQYAVYLSDGKTRLGELDEEFVFESRIGDVFLLGSHAWRIQAIERDRLLVSQAHPSEALRMPFWRGEGVGRPYELGREIGAARREIETRLDDAGVLDWMRAEFGLSRDAALNLHEYLLAQRRATGRVPSDETLVVERFRDEIGDPRIVVHSPFGGRVNGAWALALSRRLGERVGVEVQTQYNDDGIILRFPDQETAPPDADLLALRAADAERIVIEDVGLSPLFGALFRENAERALLLPRRRGRKRTPFWLQRLKAGDLLQVVRAIPDFPIVVETYKEALTSALDVARLREVLDGLASGRIRTHVVATDVPSPFASSLVFQFTGVFLYEWDTPKAERGAATLPVSRETLKDALDRGRLADLLKPEAIEAEEGELQRVVPGRRARSVDELAETFLALGPLNEAEIRARSDADPRPWLDALARDGRIVPVEVAGEPGWREAEDEGDGVAVARRHLRTRAASTAEELARRRGWSPDRARAALDALVLDGAAALGEFRPGGARREYADRGVLARVHRRTLALLRREVEPVDLETFQSFLLRWQGLHPETRRAGIAGLLEAARQLAGAAIPAEVWDRDAFPARVDRFDPAALADLTTSGEHVWVGAGEEGAERGRLRLLPRGEAGAWVAPPGGIEVQAQSDRVATRAALERQGASFFPDLRHATGFDDGRLARALAGLVRAGEVTNDSFAALKSALRGAAVARAPSRARPPRRPGGRRAAPPVWMGRWTLTRSPAVLGPEEDADARARRVAVALLDRYGVVVKEWHDREGGRVPWSAVADALKRMEMAGEARRGYFVRGLTGLQFAHPDAVEALAEARARGSEPVATLLNATDPALVYGAGVSPEGTPRFSRSASTYVVLEGGAPALVAERHGERVTSTVDDRPDALARAVAALARLLDAPPAARARRFVTISRWNDRPVLEVETARRALADVGFDAEGGRAILVPSHVRT